MRRPGGHDHEEGVGGGSADYIERLLLKRDRGILLGREVVDLAFGTLAYEGRFDLIEQSIRRLARAGLKAELRSWADWDEGRPGRDHHYWPFDDSRLIVYHFGDPYGSTSEQREALRAELRLRVARIARMTRDLLDASDR